MLLAKPIRVWCNLNVQLTATLSTYHAFLLDESTVFKTSEQKSYSFSPCFSARSEPWLLAGKIKIHYKGKAGMAAGSAWSASQLKGMVGTSAFMNPPESSKRVVCSWYLHQREANLFCNHNYDTGRVRSKKTKAKTNAAAEIAKCKNCPQKCIHIKSVRLIIMRGMECKQSLKTDVITSAA